MSAAEVAAIVDAVNTNTNVRAGIADKNEQLRLATVLAAIAADPDNPVTQEMVDLAVSRNNDALAAAIVATLPAGSTDTAAVKQAVKDAIREGTA